LEVREPWKLEDLGDLEVQEVWKFKDPGSWEALMFQGLERDGPE